MKNLYINLALATIAFTMLVSSAVAKQSAKMPNLIETAVAVNTNSPFAGEFDTLLLLAGMDDEVATVLSQKGQYTVFAPTDSAFDNLFNIANDNCITLDADIVNAVLKYHVVKGRRDSEAVLESDKVKTLVGAFFEQSGGVITDNANQQSNIIVTDVAASNGIIHAIDTVILPFPVVNACQ